MFPSSRLVLHALTVQFLQLPFLAAVPVLLIGGWWFHVCFSLLAVWWFQLVNSFQCVHAMVKVVRFLTPLDHRKPFLDRLCFCFHTGFLSLIGVTVSASRYLIGSGRYVSISRITVSACVALWLSLSAVLSLYLFTVFTVFTKLSIYYKLTLFYLYIFLSKYDEHDEQSKKNTVNIGVFVFTGSVHWLFTGCVHWLNL